MISKHQSQYDGLTAKKHLDYDEFKPKKTNALNIGGYSVAEGI